jgi:hypothetical protein
MKTGKHGLLKVVFSLLLALALVAGLLPALTPAASAAATDVWVGGYSIDPAESDSGEGWAWDVATQTLTLDADYTGEGITIASGDPATVAIVGNVVINTSSTYGIRASGPLTITGAAADSLTITSTSNAGISLYGDSTPLTITGLTVDITSTSFGIDCNDGSITISGANVTVKTSGNRPIWALTAVTIDEASTVKLVLEGLSSSNYFASTFIRGKLYNSGDLSYWTSVDITSLVVDDATPVPPPPPPVYVDSTDPRYAAYGNVAYIGDSASKPILVQTPAELQQLYALVDYQNSLYASSNWTEDFPLYVKFNASTFALSGNWNPVYLWGGDRIYIDGNNATITGLYVTPDPQEEIGYEAGLFSVLDNVEIRNLTIVSPRVEGYNTAGALAGRADASRIINVQATDVEIKGGRYAGGIVGDAGDYVEEGVFLANSGVTGGTVTVTGLFGLLPQVVDQGSYYAGGVVGRLYDGLLYNAYNHAAVRVDDVYTEGKIYAGGIVGDLDATKCLFNSYSVGSVTVNASAVAEEIAIGGIAGYLRDNAINNYASGAVAGPGGSDIGQAFGVVADDDGSNGVFLITRNYYTGGAAAIGHYANYLGSNTLPAGIAEQISDPATLLATLNAGVPYLNSVADSHGMINYAFAAANTKTWAVSGATFFGVPKPGTPVHGLDNTNPPPPPIVTTRYTIVSSAGEGGAISPLGSTAVDSGSGKTYAITPDEGYAIADVLVDGESVGTASSYEFKNVRANHTISVTFAPVEPGPSPAPITHIITATAGDGGGINPAGVTVVADGGSQSYVIIADEGYAVESVTVDGTALDIDEALTAYGYDFNDVRADHTIVVSFVLVTIDLTPDDVPLASIDPPQTGDAVPLALLFVLFAAAAVAFGAVSRKRAKSRR